MSHRSPDYTDPANVVQVRIFHEDGEGWTLDGVDRQGRYTEACRTFDTEDEAVAAAASFRADHSINPAAGGPGKRPVTTRRQAYEEIAFMLGGRCTHRTTLQSTWQFPTTDAALKCKEIIDAIEPLQTGAVFGLARLIIAS